MSSAQPLREPPVEGDLHALIGGEGEVVRAVVLEGFLNEVLQVPLHLKDMSGARRCPDGLRDFVPETTDRHDKGPLR